MSSAEIIHYKEKITIIIKNTSEGVGGDKKEASHSTDL